MGFYRSIQNIGGPQETMLEEDIASHPFTESLFLAIPLYDGMHLPFGLLLESQIVSVNTHSLYFVNKQLKHSVCVCRI